MMDFDKLIDRRIYPTQKWNPTDLKQHFGSDDLLPFWIADMDLPAPPSVVNTLVTRAEHGLYGYEYRPDSFYDALIGWYQRRHQWTMERSHIESCPGVLSALAILINQHTDEGDGIILQPPVFFEFRLIVRKNGRKIVKNPLRLVDGQYQMDFVDLEEKAADPRNKLLILCNPHNPVGRVWRREELEQVAAICHKHNVLVVSDEIHGDIVYQPHRYLPYATVSETAVNHSFTLLSPAKTFNLAGMVDGLVVIPNDDYRQQYAHFADRYQINRTNVFTSAAVEAAYREGEGWLEALLTYLGQNVAAMQAHLQPPVKLIEPEGTYLVWLDFRELGLEPQELSQFLAQKAGLALNFGYWFGGEGAGFARMNIATPRPLLVRALTQLNHAVGYR